MSNTQQNQTTTPTDEDHSMTLIERATAAAADAERQFAALPGDEDLHEQIAARRRKRDELSARVVAIRSDVAAVTSLEPTLAADVVWRDHLVAWRNTLTDELSAFPAKIYDDRELGRKQNVEFSIRAIDRGSIPENAGYSLNTLRLGQLMREAGYQAAAPEANTNGIGVLRWFGTLREVEHRISTFGQRYATAKARLEEALHDDATREAKAKAQAEAEAERRAAAAKAPKRGRRMDGSEYDRYPDGRVVEVKAAVPGALVAD